MPPAIVAYPWHERTTDAMSTPENIADAAQPPPSTPPILEGQTILIDFFSFFLVPCIVLMIFLLPLTRFFDKLLADA